MPFFHDNYPDLSIQGSWILDKLYGLMTNYIYENSSEMDIIKKEMEIYEYADEYLPGIIADLDSFFDYINTYLQNNLSPSNDDVDSFILNIISHIHHLEDYKQNYAELSDDSSYRTPMVDPNWFKKFSSMKERTYLTNLLYSYHDIHLVQEKPIEITDKHEIAKERKQKLFLKIISYLRDSEEPVSVYGIHEQVPGATYQVIDMVRKDPYVIDYKDKLFFSFNLKIDQPTKDILQEAILDTFFIEKTHTSEEIYRQLQKKHSSLLSKLHITNPYNMYSVFHYLFRNDFIFVRPKIGLPGQAIAKPLESITQFLCKKHKTTIAELKEFISDSEYDINVNLNLFNKLPDVILINQNTLIHKESLSLTRIETLRIACLIRQELMNAEEGIPTKAIRDLTCIVNFPISGYELNEWLIYSILTKYDWTDKDGNLALYTFSTSPYLNRAIPIVSLNSSIDKDIRISIAEEHAGTTYGQNSMTITDLSSENLDQLIEDEIDYDWDLEGLDEEDDSL